MTDNVIKLSPYKRRLPIYEKHFCSDCEYAYPKRKPRKFIVCSYEHIPNCLEYNKNNDCVLWKKEFVAPKGLLGKIKYYIECLWILYRKY